MKGNNQVCAICGSESGSIACICDGEIKILGNQCIADHLQDATSVHDLVNLDLALRMNSDFNLFNQYLTDIPDISKILNSLKLYSLKLRSSKAQLQDEKSILFSRLEVFFNEISQNLEGIEQDINFQIKQVSEYKRTLGEDGRAMFEISRAEGIEKLFKNYFQKMIIPTDLIIEHIKKNITIEYLRSNIGKSDQEEERITYQTEITERDRRIEELINKHGFELQEKNILIEELKRAIDFSVETEKNLKKEIDHLTQSLRNYEVNSIPLTARNQKNKEYEDKIQTYKTQLNQLQQKIVNLKKNMKLLENKSIQQENQLKLLEDKSRKQGNQLKLLEEVKNTHIEESKLLSHPKQLKPPEEVKTYNSAHQPNTIVDRDKHFRTFSGKRYIYTARTNTTYIVQFDVQTRKSCTYDLELPLYFNGTNTCELPNGDLLIAGFLNLNSSSVYLFKLATEECIKLANMHKPKSVLSLFYYRDFVYAFGESDPSSVERYNLKKNFWKVLPKMKYARSRLSCVGIGKKIYLFSGNNTTIEVFDTDKKQFKDFNIKNAENSTCFGIAYRSDNRIYLVTNTLIQFYDTSMKKLGQYRNTIPNECKSLNSIIGYQQSFYFYNDSSETIEKVDTLLSFSPPLIGYNNKTEYIYRTVNNTKSLIRMNLQSFTMETIDMNLYRNYSNTSVCLLENGLVFIAGFYSPISGESFLYNPNDNSFFKMSNLNTPRYHVGLIYHSSFVYAFGGRNASGSPVEAAEKLNIGLKMEWILCTKMVKARSLPSCVGVDNKIYLIGGAVQSIEIYDTQKDTYMLSNVQLGQVIVVSVLVNDQIFIIGDNYYKILSKDLVPLSELQIPVKNIKYTYTSANIQVIRDKIYFYNSFSTIFEIMNIGNFERSIEIINHLTTS